MLRTILSALILLITTATAANAGTWGVSPTRIDIDTENPAPVLTVINRTKEPVKVQARLMVWSQDADGNDIVKESKDLVFFPRQMTVEGMEERGIKIGSLKSTVTASEKTYRIMVEEIPAPNKRTDKMSVSFLTRMSVPIYIAPANPTTAAKLGEVKIDKKQIVTSIINTGNTHFTVRGVTAVGKSKEGKELCRRDTNKQWYHYALNKITYDHKLDLPECSGTQPATFEITVNTDPPIEPKLSKTVSNIGQ